MSEAKTPTIHEVFAAAKKAIGPVGKTGKNTQQNYNFRGIDAVVNAAAPHLDEHGVIPIPVLQDIDYQTVEVGQKRTPMAHVRVKVTYQFWGPAGDHLDATVPGEAMDSGDKATAKAMSVAYRIALLQALNLPTSEADPDAQTYERSPHDESWRNSQPVNRPRRDANGHGDDPFAAGEWAEQALQRALALPDAEAARVLWREVSEAASAGAITEKQRDDLHELITAQVQDLRREQPPAVTTASTPDGDPWLAKIEEITSEEDAAKVREELDAAHGGGLVDSRRHKALGVAIRTRLNSLKVTA